jgi:hypothetical protein
MTRTITSFLAAALIAGSATVAFASDNGDGAMTQDSIRNTQRGIVTSQAKAYVPFAYAGANTVQINAVMPEGPTNGAAR